MSLEDVLQKVVSGESLSEDEIETVKAFKMPDVSSAKNEAAANARKKATEQHKAELEKLREELVEAQEQIEAGTGTKTEAERQAKAVEKLQKQLESLANEKAELQAANETIQRDHAFGQVMSGLDWMDDSTRDVGALALKQRLADVEDLTDTDAVSEIVSNFEKSTPALFRGAQPVGTGTKNQGGTAKQIVSIGSGNASQADIDAAWAAAS